VVRRQCCRVYRQPVATDTSLRRWAHLIGPESLAALNDQAVALARSLKIPRRRQVRVDSMVVATHIHSRGVSLADCWHPCDMVSPLA